MQVRIGWGWAEEVRHASRNADSACPVLYWRDGKKGHAESAFRDACRTSSGGWVQVRMGWGWVQVRVGLGAGEGGVGCR